MSKSRKTFNVAELKEEANKMLSLPESEVRTDEWRLGIFYLTEKILMATGNYFGFNYVEWLDGGYKKWNEDGRPEDNIPYLGNQTRRRFY